MSQVTRRETLGATGTVAASSAGCLARGDDDSAATRTARDQVTEARTDAPVDQTGSGSGTITVYAGGETKQVDISAHDRPIQAAIDTATATDPGRGGRVMLPANSVIEEAGTIQMENGIELMSPSMATAVIITKQGVPGIEVGGADMSRLHNFTLKGPAGDDQQGETGPAILNTGGVNDFNIGQLNIFSWNNAAIKCANLENDFFWASNFGHIRTGVDAGDEKGEFVLKGLALSFGLLHCYPYTDYSGKNSDIIHLVDSVCRIDMMNLGGALGRAIYQDSAPIVVGGVNYEPTHQVEIPPEVFSLGGASGWRNGSHIGQVTNVRHENPHGNSRIAQYCYTLRERHMGHRLPHPSRPQNFRKNVLNVQGKSMEALRREGGAPPHASPSFYFGFARDVDNNAGTDAGTVRALGAAGTAVD